MLLLVEEEPDLYPAAESIIDLPSPPYGSALSEGRREESVSPESWVSSRCRELAKIFDSDQRTL